MAEVVDGGLVFHVEAEALALKAGLVNQHTGVGLKPRESAHDVPVHSLDLADGPRILEGLHRLLLHCKDDAVVTLQANRRRPTIHSLESVLNLEDFAIRSEDADRFVVLCHNY